MTTLLPVALAVLLFALTVIPLLTVFAGSLRPNGLPLGEGWTLRHYATVWGSRYTYVLFVNTAIFAVGSAAVAIAIATVLAWLLERSDLPGRDIFRAGILMPMITPPLLLAIGWVLLMSPQIGIFPLALQKLTGSNVSWFSIYSMPSMIFVQALAYIPTAILILAPVMRNMDPTFEEAAFVTGATAWQTVRRVSLPFLSPALLSAATLLLLVGMMTFDIPAIIGLRGNIPVLSSEIFRFMNPPSGLPAYGPSAALNSSLFILLIIGLFIYYRATRNAEQFASISGKSYKATRFPLGRWRFVALGFVLLYFCLAVALPFSALLWASLVPYFSRFDVGMLSRLSLDAYSDVFGNPRVFRAAVNSVIVALTASVGVTLLALVTAWVIIRSRLRWVWVLDVLAMIPISIPHLVMGIALIFIFFSIRFIPLYGTVWIIAIGHLIAYLPVASRMMQAGILQINKELEEAAIASGASWRQTMQRIVIPLLKPTIVALMIWMIVHSIREFSIAVILKSGRNEVLSTILYSLWETGEPERAAAIAVVLMACLGILGAVLSVTIRSES